MPGEAPKRPRGESARPPCSSAPLRQRPRRPGQAGAAQCLATCLHPHICPQASSAQPALVDILRLLGRCQMLLRRASAASESPSKHFAKGLTGSPQHVEGHTGIGHWDIRATMVRLARRRQLDGEHVGTEEHGETLVLRCGLPVVVAGPRRRFRAMSDRYGCVNWTGTAPRPRSGARYARNGRSLMRSSAPWRGGREGVIRAEADVQALAYVPTLGELLDGEVQVPAPGRRRRTNNAGRCHDFRARSAGSSGRSNRAGHVAGAVPPAPRQPAKAKNHRPGTTDGPALTRSAEQPGERPSVPPPAEPAGSPAELTPASTPPAAELPASEGQNHGPGDNGRARTDNAGRASQRP